MSDDHQMKIFERPLGRSGIRVSAIGLGCWPIAGSFSLGGEAGWGKVDDDESIRAIREAVDLGVRFFDVADIYGAGHGEEVLGRALEGRLNGVVIATKFGGTFDAERKVGTGRNTSPAYVPEACEASLRRLRVDAIDLYQLHIPSLPAAEAEAIADVLDDLCDKGSIRSYGWSTDEQACARVFAARPYCTAIQHTLNVLEDAPDLLRVCEAEGLASINRSPLAMGVLTGKYTAASTLPPDDLRGVGHEWVPYFEGGRPRRELLQRLDAVREILTSGGRTVTQGALAWIWGRSENTIPIPGFKTVDQVRENVAAVAHGPLTGAQMTEIEALLRAG